MHHLRLVLVGLAAVVALILGWNLFDRARRLPAVATVQPDIAAPAPKPAEPSPGVLARRKVETKIAETPDYLRFFDRLKLVFPGEYEAILDKLAKRVQSGGAAEEPDVWMADAVRSLRLSRGIMAAKADTPALAHVFEMQLAMMKALAASDKRLCVDFLYGGASRGFYQFSSANRALVADMAIAGLDAIDDGQQKKVERSAPTDADFQLLDAALTDKGLTKPEIEAILDGKTSDPPIDDARMCEVGRIYLETLAALPDPARARIYGLAVELMARS